MTFKDKEIALLKTCLLESERHVTRQVHAGKHQQDRDDAIQWIERWKQQLKTWKITL